MPFQPINFANIAPQGSPFLRDFVETLSQGMDLGRKPQRLEQEAKSRDFMNTINQAKAQYAPEREKADLESVLGGNQSRSITNQELAQRLHANLMAKQGEIALNPFRRALLESQARSAGSVADKNAIQQELMNKYLKRPSGDSQGGAADFGLASVLNKALGMGAPKVVDMGGQKMLLSAAGMQPLGGDQDYVTNTPAVRTLNANIVNGVSNALPLIDELGGMDIPTQTWGNLASPNLQAAYKSKTAQAADTIVAAMGLPKTNESINLVKQMVERKPWEGMTAYRKRLGDLKKDLIKRRSSAKDVLKSGTSTQQSTVDDPLGLR